MVDLHAIHDGLVVTAFWEAKPGEVDSVVEILKRFLPQAQREPGVQAFQIHQSLSEPQKFFFYEVFRDEAAFAVGRAANVDANARVAVAGQIGVS